jgi:hypothetical protein
MDKFDVVKQQFLAKGVQESTIDYAIESVKYGTKREFILDNLMADYRGMNREDAVSLVEALFIANGGEFKKENKGGYLYGGVLLAVGVLLGFYIGYVLLFGGVLIRPILVVAATVFCLASGGRLLFKAVRGKYRDSDEPFSGKDSLAG